MSYVEPRKTASEIAEALNITRPMVLYLARTGQIPSIKLGHKTVRFSLSEVLDALKNHSRTRASHRANTEVYQWVSQQPMMQTQADRRT